MLVIAVGGCTDDTTAQPTPLCAEGAHRCTDQGVEVCNDPAAGWTLESDCAGDSKVCVPDLWACRACIPGSRSCAQEDVVECAPDGESESVVVSCDPSGGFACRDGACKNLCADAKLARSNVGCEYWAVDLDNANIDQTSNAASQQFAVVVSNPQPDFPASIVIEQDDGAVGEASIPVVVATATVAPRNLQVFKLGPREVDGSPRFEFNTGSHTAHTRAAYRIRSDFPVVAYQFNPLENVSVFSNDASLLYPTEALAYGSGSLALNYVVVGWPQTIAATDDPETNFDPIHPIHLRSFLTIVGTEPNTAVRVVSKTQVVAGGPVGENVPGDPIEVELQPFEVLNLETGAFLADFTGTEVYSSGPVAVFSGSEAADAPHFLTLSERRCCADHLEDQLAPVRAAGKSFQIPHTPNRGEAVLRAGASVSPIEEPDFVRFVATTDRGAVIHTTLPKPDDVLVLEGRGDFAEVRAYGHFSADSSEPISVAQIMASQQATGVTRTGYPGGDPSLMLVPPIEQARQEIVFLTPDKYAFDYLTVVAPADAEVRLDDQILDANVCDLDPADGLTTAERGSAESAWTVYTCQLSFPTIDGSIDPPSIGVGMQNDGVHRLSASSPVFAVITGWDAYVSYAYAGGTDLRDIAPPQ